MKNEEFDDAVRKKLESINQPYSESDIEKVFQHVKKNRRFAWKGLSGSWLFYTLSAAAMVSVATFVIFRPDVHEIKTQLKVSHEMKSSSGKQPVITTIDTSTDNKHTETETGISENFPSDTNSTPSVNVTPIPAIAIQKNTSADSKPVKNSVTDQIVNDKTSEPEQVSAQNPDTTTAKQKDNISVVNSSAFVPEAVISQNTKASLNQGLAKTETRIDTGGKSESVVKLSSPVLADSAGTTSDLSINNGENLSTTFTFRTAALFSVSNQKLGTGISADVLFGKYFGLTAGITYNFLQKEQFSNKADMFGHHPPGFNPPFEDHFRDKEHVTDITIQSQLLQLPLAFNFYIPLKRNFVVRMSLGTDLDIYLKQNSSFNHKIDSSRFEEPHFGTQGKVVPFNTMLFGAGIEKRWNHWVMGAQPYYNLHVKDVFYKPRESEFGIGVSILYSFGK